MKIDRSSQLQRALEQIGRDPARLEEALDQVMAQTGATAAELRALLAQGDAFGGDQRRLLEGLLDRRLSRTVVSPKEGARAHVLRAQKHKPWFGAVSQPPTLGPKLHPEPSRDIEVGGEKLAREELFRMLRGAT